MFLVLVILLSFSGQGQEYVGGVLTQNSTYSPGLNPYIVTEPLIVPEGITLTIEAGTQLYFMVRTSLRVEGGVLLAQGLPGQEILFTSHGPGDNEKKWDGINFFSSGYATDESGNYLEGNLIQYSNVQLTTTGIVVSDTAGVFIESAGIRNCDYGLFLEDEGNITLKNSVVDQCSYGMYIKNSGSNIISSCEITNCDIGIFFPSNNNSRYNQIVNNNISNNRNIGLFLSLGQSTIQYNAIRNNTVSYNNIGLHIGNGGNADAGFNSITGNIVHNNDIGIKLSQDKDTLKGNHVADNETGILLSRASYSQIEYNYISGNRGWGMILTDASNNNRITGNNINNNLSGIKLTEKDLKYSVNNLIIGNNIARNTNEAILLEAGPQSGIHYNSFTGREENLVVNRFETNVPATENYWFTSDTALINQMIYDRFDNQDYGIVQYRPFLDAPNPLAPVSCPRHVIKRLAGTEIHVSWLPNPETDLAGYLIYFDSEDGITFNQVADVGLATEIMLQGIAFSSHIAVSAYDTDADGQNDRTEGHESAATPAVPGPWAGEDVVVCGDAFYYTQQATAIDFTSLEWTTAGDGNFADPLALLTWYEPGPNDLQLGSVILNLTATVEGLTISDEVEITLAEIPSVFAGYDTIINQMSGYFTLPAQAGGYTNLYWQSSGDGSFENDTLLHTLYNPGEQDLLNGEVTLTVNIESECGNISDALLVQIIPAYNISGRVHAGSAAVSGGVVVALRKENDGSRAIDFTSTSMSGDFMLEALSGGEYLLYALPDPQGTLQNLVPAYYAGKTMWSSAYKMQLSSDVTDVDIYLPKAYSLNVEGTGSISGEFRINGETGRDTYIYNQPWFSWQQESPATVPPTAAVNHVVLLMNPSLSHILGWALTDETGNFSFGNLPFGSYRLWGEKAGFSNSISPVITLSPSNPDIENVELVQQGKTIEISIPQIPGNPQPFTIYPNPASATISIAGNMPDLENCNIRLFDASGRIAGVYHSQSSETSYILLDVSNYPAGIYILEISTGGGMVFREKISIIK